MKKRVIHKSPAEYRVRYCINGSVEDSTQYYSVYHSSEALEFLAHTFRRGHIHGGDLKVVDVEEYNRFTTRWESRLVKAVEHAEMPEIQVIDGKVFLKKWQTNNS